MAEKRASSSRGRAMVGDVCDALDAIAPPHLAAEWDNVGLLIGDRARPARRLLLTIDLTGPVLREAARAGADMVLAYHPPIFKPLSRLTADAAPVALAAARAGLAVYSPHTALDAAAGGTNDVLAEAVGIRRPRPLEPVIRRDRCKVAVFASPADVPAVAAAAFAAGAGRIGNYGECSFRAAGVGTFRGDEGSSPAVGRAGRREQVEEFRLEVVAPRDNLAAVLAAVRAAHSYETPAIDVYPLEDVPPGVGMGRIGELARAVTVGSLVARVKRALGLERVLLAGPTRGKVKLAACCAGSCGELFRSAAGAGAGAYVTGEMRHHDSLAAAAAGMTCICVGHSNSERLVLPGLRDRIRHAVAGLDVRISRADRDPQQVV